MRRNNVTILFLAIVMGGVAAFLARNWIESRSRAFAAGDAVGTIVVAAEPLKFGAEVSPDSVTEISWIAKSLPDGAFVSRDELLKDGRRVVLSPLGRGEPILRSKVTGPGQRALLSSLLDEGKRAVTVRVDDVRGVAGFILPGDFVDVVLIAEDGPPRRENYSEILLQHVKVLAVDQLASERQEQPTVAKAVTVEVTPEQAQKVLLATNIGKLSLILRRPEEANANFGRRVTERDLGRIDPRTISETARPAPAPPPVAATPPPAPPTNTAKVAVVRNNKREEYTVHRVDN
ncbi:MAG TPA: Flp pilus assembly protein CpaB [Xanthobacteraceae bacterium]